MTTENTAPNRTDGVLTYAKVGDLTLESGAVLPDVTIGYETWGTLNEAGDNAILILHALTGDTHVSAGHVRADASEQDRAYAEAAGWWPTAVGPGRVIDTDKYFVISPNMLGGCYGTTGPASPAPASIDPEQKPWGSRFPLVTIRDGVRAEKRLLDQLGVTSLHHVIGGSLGGARAAEWAVTYPSAPAPSSPPAPPPPPNKSPGATCKTWRSARTPPSPAVTITQAPAPSPA